MSNISTDLDGFGVALESIISDVERAVKTVPEPAVKEGLKAGAKEWRANAPRQRGKYAKSIKWHLTKGGDDAEGEIGSPTMPGLPHLLEKGHARVGGGRVPAYPHIAPAAEVAFKETEEAILRRIEEVL